VAAGDTEEHIFHSLRELLIHKLDSDDEKGPDDGNASGVGRTSSGRRYEYVMADPDMASPSPTKHDTSMGRADSEADTVPVEEKTNETPPIVATTEELRPPDEVDDMFDPLPPRVDSVDTQEVEEHSALQPSRSAPALGLSTGDDEETESADCSTDLAGPSSCLHDDHTGSVSDRMAIARSVTSKSSFDLSQNLTPVFTTDVLTDPLTLKMITRFAEHHKIPNGVDMIRFWVEIDELQHLPSHSYTHRRLRKIYDKFLSPEAQSPVCVTGHMLQEIEQALETDNISAGMYAEAQTICFVALERSVYPRFRDSKLFKKMQDFCSPAIPTSSGGGGGGNGNASSGRNANGGDGNGMGDGLDEDFSLMGVLNHPAKLRFLKTFCMEALALENLLFYLEVEDCKRLPNLSFITSKTRKIYDRYCSPSSRNYIRGIDAGGALRDLQLAVENHAPLLPKLFYEAQLVAFDRISDEIWRGFCRTQEYLQHSKTLQPERKSSNARHRPTRGSGSSTLGIGNGGSGGATGTANAGGSMSDQSAAVQQKVDALSEVQLIEAAMHYPVEKLIPIKYNTPASDRQSLAVFLLATHGGSDGDSMSPQEQLATVLGDPYAKKYFKQFMNKRGVDQLLAFCEEVEDFKLLPGIEYLQHSAKKIYRKYMMPSARLQVDMSTSMRDEIFMRLANPSVDMFKKIAARVRQGMLQDSLPRFVKSPQYNELKREVTAARAASPGLEQELKAVDAAGKSGKLELSHLDVFLLNQTCMRAFRTFLELQHCSENLMLWEEIEHFRRLPSYQIVLRSARKIYDKYLNPSNARMVIPLSDALRGRVTDQLDVASRTTFDEVENECFDVMRNIVLPDFLDSRIFMALVGTWATVDDDYPADMLRGEFEMAFLRHRFHLVQETRGLSRDSSTPLLERVRASGGMGS
jgi:hypothetical protein